MWLAPWKALRSPDPWQSELLSQIVTQEQDVMVCCSRQSGKTESVSAAAYLVACLGGFVLVVGPSDKQALEFHERVLKHHANLGLCRPSEEPTKHELRLVSGGRVVAVPNNERTVRSKSAVDLLVVDEASRVPDSLYGATRAMLAVSKGHTVLLSTPFGQRGFFYKEWDKGTNWLRHEVPWQQCPRIPKSFIDSERRQHGDAWVAQEYECRFLDVSGAAVFDVEAMEGLVEDSGVVDIW